MEVANSTGGPPNPASRSRPKETLGEMYDKLVRQKEHSERTGTWFWPHLEPTAFSKDGQITSVRLQCLHCQQHMAASNPSRTATEHLRSGACKKFKEKHGDMVDVTDGGTASGSFGSPDPPKIIRKRLAPGAPLGADAMSRAGQEPNAQQMLQSNLKKVRQSDGGAAPAGNARGVGRPHSDASLVALCDFVYETCSSIPLAALSHPRLCQALAHVGSKGPPRFDLTGSRLDAKYEEVRGASLAKLRSSSSFQLASDGWAQAVEAVEDSTRLINIMVNIPSGCTLFQKVVSLEGPTVTDASLEETLQAALAELPEGQSRSCLGVVTDADIALKPGMERLEAANPWLLACGCQRQAIAALLTDLVAALPRVQATVATARSLLEFFDSNPPARDCLARAMAGQFQHILPLRLPAEAEANGMAIVGMLQDTHAACKAFQAVMLDPLMLPHLGSGPAALQLTTTLSSLQFWADLERLLTLLLPIRDIVLALQADRPILSQCLALWNVIRSQAEQWAHACGEDKAVVLEVVEKQFQANYHQAWAASYVLDPLYLVPGSTSDRWVPPFEKLSPQQRADAETIIKRLAPTDALRPQALMEFTRFRFEGVDPEYARAVQLRQRNPRTNQEEVPNAQVRRVLWESHLAGYSVLSQAAIRLMSLHATACGPRRDGARWAALHKGASNIARERAHKMLLIASQGMLDRKDYLDPWDQEQALSSDIMGVLDVVHAI